MAKLPTEFALNLATKTGLGQIINCSSPPTNFNVCGSPLIYDNGGVINPDNPLTYTPQGYVGVIGTPVIDISVQPDPLMYVVGGVSVSGVAQYYLFAIDILNGSWQTLAPVPISTPTVSGGHPGAACETNGSGQGLSFNPNDAIQRQALLQVSPGGPVYITFANYPENTMDNGWIVGYVNSNGAFQQTVYATPTPTGTGGGFWGSGAGPAADASGGSEAGSIFTATGNGSYDGTTNWGDSLLRLNPASSTFWPPADSYTPANVNTYCGNTAPPKPMACGNGSTNGLCSCDMDVSSGGVLVAPALYKYNGNKVVINADKQSNIYVANQANLGGQNNNGGNNIQVIQTPTPTGTPYTNCNQKQQYYQGYWASPAYWHDGTDSIDWLFYAATDPLASDPAIPMYGFQLATIGTSGPVPASPSATTNMGPNENVAFCNFAPTPSVSSNGTSDSSGIVWAIETPNGHNPRHCDGTPSNIAVLHAFCATTVNHTGNPCGNGGGTGTGTALTQLYVSTQNVSTTPISKPVPFLPPVIFNGLVFMGTAVELTQPPKTQIGTAEVDVFGPCSVNPNSTCKP